MEGSQRQEREGTLQATGDSIEKGGDYDKTGFPEWQEQYLRQRQDCDTLDVVEDGLRGMEVDPFRSTDSEEGRHGCRKDEESVVNALEVTYDEKL